MGGSHGYLFGRLGEDLACEFLKENGFFIAARNYRSTYGEIDIVAESKEWMVFVEVKLRRNDSPYFPGEAVTPNKRKRIIHAAKNYRFRTRNSIPYRYDIIEITMNDRQDLKDADINWIRDAFTDRR